METRTEFWRSQILSPTNVIVAEDQGGIVGFVACGPEREVAADVPEPDRQEDVAPHSEELERCFEVYGLHVDPVRRREGIGAALFGAACSLAQTAGAHEIAAWVEANNGSARKFCERVGLGADLLRAARPAPDGEGREIRYRAAVEPAEDAPGKADWKLLQPVVKEDEPDTWRERILVGGGMMLLAGVVALWMFPALREQLAARESRRQMLEAPVDQARRAAERELQVLLRPVDHKGNIGRDPSARQWRLGLAYGRLALIEERAGDVRKRDRYFELARGAMKEAGVEDPTDRYIREHAGVKPSAPR